MSVLGWHDLVWFRAAPSRRISISWGLERNKRANWIQFLQELAEHRCNMWLRHLCWPFLICWKQYKYCMWAGSVRSSLRNQCFRQYKFRDNWFNKQWFDERTTRWSDALIHGLKERGLCWDAHLLQWGRVQFLKQLSRAHRFKEWVLIFANDYELETWLPNGVDQQLLVFHNTRNYSIWYSWTCGGLSNLFLR